MRKNIQTKQCWLISDSGYVVDGMTGSYYITTSNIEEFLQIKLNEYNQLEGLCTEIKKDEDADYYTASIVTSAEEEDDLIFILCELIAERIS